MWMCWFSNAETSRNTWCCTSRRITSSHATFLWSLSLWESSTWQPCYYSGHIFYQKSWKSCQGIFWIFYWLSPRILESLRTEVSQTSVISSFNMLINLLVFINWLWGFKKNSEWTRCLLYSKRSTGSWYISRCLYWLYVDLSPWENSCWCSIRIHTRGWHPSWYSRIWSQ